MNSVEARVRIVVIARRLLIVNAAIIVFSLAGTASLLHGPAPDWDYETLASVLAIANIVSATLVSLLLMVRSQGAGSTILLIALCLVIAGGLEYLSTITGFPFGHYEYTGALGPLVFDRVPLLIPVAWFMMLYPALQIGQRLKLRAVTLGLLCGAMLTVWDLALDPAMTTGFAAWLWDYTGGYYDIPPQNFAAWFATAWIIGTLHAAWGPRWRADRSRLPAALFLLQFAFAGALAALHGRPGALLVSILALGALGLVIHRRLRRVDAGATEEAAQ
ncbi:MAG: carotenoid biosynthesis protein [Armatimonadota bacterium]